jgi:hypothetical protein
MRVTSNKVKDGLADTLTSDAIIIYSETIFGCMVDLGVSSSLWWGVDESIIWSRDMIVAKDIRTVTSISVTTASFSAVKVVVMLPLATGLDN